MIPTVTETATATTAASKEAAVGQPTQGAGEHANGPAHQDADEPAHQAEHHGLDEELGQDVGGVGADGHPQPDLAGPLGDGDEHDVHDAHPAHHQRNGGHGNAQAGQACRPRRLKMLETSALS